MRKRNFELIFEHFKFNSDFTDYSITVMETKVALVCHIFDRSFGENGTWFRNYQNCKFLRSFQEIGLLSEMESDFCVRRNCIE